MSEPTYTYPRSALEASPLITLTDLDEFLGWFDHTTDCHFPGRDRCACGWWDQMDLVLAILDQAIAENWSPSRLVQEEVS
jgi:hypothetical protein